MKRRVWIVVICCLLLGAFPRRVQGAALEVAGKSAVLMDVATGTVIYESNAHEALPPASVTKVMTMLLIFCNCGGCGGNYYNNDRCDNGCGCGC